MQHCGAKDYYIVRCMSRDTLRLQDDLTRAGLDCWTPRHKRRMRRPSNRKVIKIEVPTLPSFAFIKREDFPEAQTLRDMGRCPRFSPMRYVNGGAMVYASVHAAELEGLRSDEMRALLEKAAFLPAGTLADIVDGPMVDRPVKVVGSSGQYNIVDDILTGVRIKVSPVSLKPRIA